MSAAFFEGYFVLLAVVLGYITSPKKFALVFKSVEAEDFVGPAARMAAHPYEMNLDPLPSVFVRDDVKKLIKRKRVAVISVDPFLESGSGNGSGSKPGYILAVKKHLLCPRKKSENGKEDEDEGEKEKEKEKKRRRKRKERKEKERRKREKEEKELEMKRNGGGNVDNNSFVINVMNDDVELIEERKGGGGGEEEEEIDDVDYEMDKDEKNERREGRKERKKSKKVKTKKGFQQLSESPSSSLSTSDVEEEGGYFIDDGDDDESD